MQEPLSWDPVRRGAHYCAPGCGMGCTWAMYQEAVRKAKLLADKLGSAWEPVVHENLGWHYHARLRAGYLVVHEHSSRSYCAFLDTNKHSGAGRWTGDGTTPKGAVAAVFRVAREGYEAIGKTLQAIEGA